MTTHKDVTIDNPSSDDVTVTLGASVKGIAYSVAENKQSVTFTLTDTKNGLGGTATIAVGSKSATVAIEVDIEANEVGL